MDIFLVSEEMEVYQTSTPRAGTEFPLGVGSGFVTNIYGMESGNGSGNGLPRKTR